MSCSPSCVLQEACNWLSLWFTCPLPLLFSFWCLGGLSVSICGMPSLGNGMFVCTSLPYNKSAESYK